eukprot:1175338-Pleurochrysis_carterae.AAC.1
MSRGSRDVIVRARTHGQVVEAWTGREKVEKQRQKQIRAFIAAQLLSGEGGGREGVSTYKDYR